MIADPALFAAYGGLGLGIGFVAGVLQAEKVIFMTNTQGVLGKQMPLMTPSPAA